MTEKQYDESSFRVLKGLEPVRERPGMYTRTDSPCHMVQEVIDNAADEALGGFAKNIHVAMFRDGSVSVTDDGRGIPVGLHPVEKLPVVVLAYTVLHAGGKFDKKSGNSAYAFSGGLHGVGVAVTTALSTRVEVEVRREGRIHQIQFLKGGREISELVDAGPCAKQTGTRVRVWPDGKYFDSPKVPLNELERLLRSKAVLLPGVKVVLDVEQADASMARQEWRYADGLAGYLREMSAGAEALVPLYTGESYAGQDEDFAPGEGAAWCFGWFDGHQLGESYVNLIPTVGGAARAITRLAYRRVRGGEELHRASQPVAEGREDPAGRCLRQDELRTFGTHSRSAIPGAGERETQFARSREAGFLDADASLRGLAQPERRARQGDCRHCHQAGAIAPQGRAEG